MVRPYGIKVNKRNERQERYDKEEYEEEENQPKFEEKQESMKKAKIESNSKAEEEDNEENEIDEEAVDDVDVGIPIVLSHHNKDKPGVIFVLEKASLEVAKVGKTYVLLNSDDHANFLRKNHRNPAHYRPDITHQALMMILDSPVNKAGRLKAVYVRTEQGVLFEIQPHLGITRTYKRFAWIMSELLQKLSITAEDSRQKLLLSCSHVALSFQLGAMSHGKIDCDYIEDFVAISGYPLSAAYCVSRICEALSTNWNII